MAETLRDELGRGQAVGVQQAIAHGHELLRLLAQRATLRDPVEVGREGMVGLTLSGRAPEPGLGVYSCPEYERGPGSEPSQVYFVAAVLYHLLSGRPPFPEVGPDALAVRKVLEPVAPLGPDVPAELAAVILQGLNADPSARPSLAALRSALGPDVSDASATAFYTMPGGGSGAPRALPTMPPPSAAMPAPRPAAAAGAGPVAAPGRPSSMTAAAPGGSGPPARRRRWPVVVAVLGLGLVLATAGVGLLFFARSEAPAPSVSAEPVVVTRAERASVDTAAPAAAAPQADREAPAAEPSVGQSSDKKDGSSSGSAAPRRASSGGGRGSAAPAASASSAPAPSIDDGMVDEAKGGGDGGPAPSAPAQEASAPAPAEPASTPGASTPGNSAPVTEAPAAQTPVAASAPAPAPRGPSPLVWVLLLIPVGLGVLLMGAGATGAAVYYTTRGHRKSVGGTGGGRSGGLTPSVSRPSAPVSTFPSQSTAPPVDEGLDAPEPGFQPFMVGPFWCFGRIGEGGMGVVYKARHRSLGRLSAVKALPPRLARDSRSLSWFRREAQLAARVQHPNVVSIFDYGELPGGLLYLAMEYVQGEPLTRRVRPGGLKAAEVRTLISQVAAGLDAAHAAGIVHRDLKPDNVVVQPAPGSRFTAKILDFGIARPADSPGDTNADLIVGTAAYMSPEQARGEPDLDARSDLFSLGVMTYELLTGKVPFVEPNMRTIQIVTRRGVLDSPPPSVQELRADLPPAVDKVLAWIMAPRREDRPGSATDFAEALSRALPA